MQRQPTESTPLLQRPPANPKTLRQQAREASLCIFDINLDCTKPKVIFSLSLIIGTGIFALLAVYMILKTITELKLCRGTIVGAYNHANTSWPYTNYNYTGSDIVTNFSCGKTNPVKNFCSQNPIEDVAPKISEDAWICMEEARALYRRNPPSPNSMQLYNTTQTFNGRTCGQLYPIPNISDWLLPFGYTSYVCLKIADTIYAKFFNEIDKVTTPALVLQIVTALVGTLYLIFLGITIGCFNKKSSVVDLSAPVRDVITRLSNEHHLQIGNDMSIKDCIKLLRDFRNSCLNRELFFRARRVPDSLIDRLSRVDQNLVLQNRILMFADLPQLRRPRPREVAIDVHEEPIRINIRGARHA